MAAVTIRKDASQMGVIPWTNGTGSAVATKTVVRLMAGCMFGVTVTAVASAAVGALVIAGEVEVDKAANLDLAEGQLVGWDDANSRVTVDLSAGVFGRVASDPTTTGTRVSVYLNDKVRRRYSVAYVATSDDNTNNYKDFDLNFPCGTLAAPRVRINCCVVNSSGVTRVGQTLTFQQGSVADVVRVADANLAAGEVIMFEAEEIASA